MRIAFPILLTVGAMWLLWRLDQARQRRYRERRYRAALSGPAETLPHADPREDVVTAASEDSFPASDPPAYTAGGRLGQPLR